VAVNQRRKPETKVLSKATSRALSQLNGKQTLGCGGSSALFIPSSASPQSIEFPVRPALGWARPMHAIQSGLYR